MRIALFIPCLTDSFYPRAGVAVVKVLEHLGHEVEYPAAQTCCGQPMFNNGFHDEARDLMRRMIEIFRPYETVVTPSGSCCAMVREQAPRLFEDDQSMRDAARALAARTYEFVEFLTRVEKVDLRAMGARWPGTATCHDSCHLRGIHAIGLAGRLAEQIEGLELRPLEQADACCGFGGTFASSYAQVSGQMVKDKVSCLAATGASTVICNDAGCTMNMSGTARRAGCDAQFTSLAEIIAESLGLLDPADGADGSKGA